MKAINRVQPARVSRWPQRSRIHKETALGLLCGLPATQGSQLDVSQAVAVLERNVWGALNARACARAILVVQAAVQLTAVQASGVSKLSRGISIRCLPSVSLNPVCSPSFFMDAKHGYWTLPPFSY